MPSKPPPLSGPSIIPPTKNTVKKAGSVIRQRIMNSEADIRLILERLSEEIGLNISSVDITFFDGGVPGDKNRTFIDQVIIKTTT